MKFAAPTDLRTELRAKPGAWVDLGLTLPVFILYHLGVVFLGVKNATDFLTTEVMELAQGDRLIYLGITAAVGVAFSVPFLMLGRGHAFRPRKFIQMIIEGSVYATFMGVGVPRLVGYIFAAKGIEEQGRFTGFIMSLGAGFYEELTFRVLLFGLGGKLLVWLFTKQKVGVISGPALDGKPKFRTFVVMLAWAVACAFAFSGMHYIGALGDPFQFRSFAARFFLGLALTFIFVTRGFSAAVWTHAIYDIWVLVLRV